MIIKEIDDRISKLNKDILALEKAYISTSNFEGGIEQLEWIKELLEKRVCVNCDKKDWCLNEITLLNFEIKELNYCSEWEENVKK